MNQNLERDDQKQEKEIKFDAGRYLGRLDQKFKAAEELGVVKPDQRAAWVEGLKHCGQQVEAANTPEAKLAALNKAISEAHSLLSFLDGMTKEARDKNLDADTFADLAHSGWLSPAEHARYWQAYEAAKTKEAKLSLRGELQRARSDSKAVHDAEWKPLTESEIAQQPENQGLIKDFEAKFWAATASEKKGVVLQFKRALEEKAEQQAKLESKVAAAEAANDAEFDPQQPAVERQPSAAERLDQRLQAAETKQHAKGLEQVAANDALYTAGNEAWINTFKKIDDSASYASATKKMEELAKDESQADDRALDDFQDFASRRQAHQAEGAGFFDKLKGAFGLGGKEAAANDYNYSQEQESPEAARASKALGEIGLKQRDALLEPLIKDLGITSIQDFQKDKLARVLLIEKDAVKRKKLIRDVMEGRKAA